MQVEDTDTQAGPSRPRSRRSRTLDYEVAPDAPDVAAILEQARQADGAALERYADELDAHITDTIRQLEGFVQRPSREGSRIPSSFGWSEACCEAFFAALSRHSRYRPDLIARDCQRPQWQVSTYIDALEDALTEDGRVSAAIIAHLEAEQPRPAKKRKFFKPGRAPAAYEVPDAWIDKEERYAQCLDEKVRQRELAFEETEARRRSAADRADIRKTVKAMKLPSSDRKIVERDRLAELDRVLLREKWDRELDAAKLGQLDEIARSITPDPLDRQTTSRSRSRSRRSSTLRPIPYDAEDADEHAVETRDEAAATAQRSPPPPSAFQIRISAEEARLDDLRAMDQITLTPEQRKEMSKLARRKNARDRYRNGTRPAVEGDSPARQTPDNLYEPKVSLDRHHKIALDNAAILQLSALKRRRRTDEQSRRLFDLKRQRQRRRHERLRSLLDSGMTEDAIEAQGGVDSAYLISQGRDAHLEDPPTLPSSEAHAKRRKGTSSTAAETPPLESNGEQALSAVAASQHPNDVETRGMMRAINLDILDYGTLAKIFDELPLSFSIIRAIHQQLLRYTKSLVCLSALVAEAEALQMGGEPEVDESHVHVAILRHQNQPDEPPHIAPDIDVTMVDNSNYDSSDLGSVTDSDHDRTDKEDARLDSLLDALDDVIDVDAAGRLGDSSAGSREVAADQVNATQSAYRSELRSVNRARRERRAGMQRPSVRPLRDVTSRRRHRGAYKSAAIVSDSDDGIQ